MGQFSLFTGKMQIYGWGILLLVGIPTLILLLGELLDRLQRRRSQLVAPVRNFRNLVLPLLSLRLILQFILEMDRTGLLVRITETVLWVLLVYSLSKLLAALVGNGESAQPGELRLSRVWSETVRMLMALGVAIYLLGGIWGAPIDQVLAALAVGSIVIGLALQDTFSSLAAGLLLAFEKPFAVGHWLRYGPYEGQIIEMNWRSVRLRTHERDVVVIPNNVLGKEVAVNYTILDPLHAERIQVSFSYRHLANQVKSVLLETALTIPGIVPDPAPHVRVVAYAYDKFAINYEIKFFTAEYDRIELIRDELLTRIQYAAQRHNFAIPYSTTVFYQGDGAHLEMTDAVPKARATLQNIPYFAALEPQVLELLAQGAAFQFFGAEERLIQQGTAFRGFYIILEGQAQLTVAGADGRMHPVTTLQAGSFFGETLLLRDQPSPFTITITRDMQALFIQRTALIEVVEANRQLLQEMNRFIEERKKMVQRAVTAAAMSNAQAIAGKNGNGLHPLLTKSHL